MSNVIQFPLSRSIAMKDRKACRPKMVSMWVYEGVAYQSEPDLFAATGMSADSAELISVPRGTREIARLKSSRTLSFDLGSALADAGANVEIVWVACPGGRDTYPVCLGHGMEFARTSMSGRR